MGFGRGYLTGLPLGREGVSKGEDCLELVLGMFF